MGTFLKKIGLFFILLFAVCLIVFGLQTWHISKQANFRFSKEYKYLMVGHSHAECAYNDSLIYDFKNIATSGESYFYTYYKLKNVLEQNSCIETVFIEFTNNQIDAKMDTWVWGDKYISKFYPKYGSFIDFRDTNFLIEHNSSSMINNFSVLQKRNLRMIFKNDYNLTDHIGGYVYYDENKLEKALRFQKKRKKKYSPNKISLINIHYLKKIVQLCEKYNKHILFVRSPQHSALYARRNETKYLQVYKENFKKIPLLDFNNFEILKKGYKDLGHLNYRGAIIISKVLDSLLKNNIVKNTFSKQDKRMIVTD